MNFNVLFQGLVITGILILNTLAGDSVSTVSPPANAQTAMDLELFDRQQFDSLLNLIPSGDSIRANDKIIAIGKTATGDSLVIFSLDPAGLPLRNSFFVKSSPAPSAAIPALPADLARDKSTVQQEGRTWFMVWSTVKGAYVYGTSWAFALDNTDTRVKMGLTFLSTGATLYGSYLFTKNMDLGYGKVAVMNCFGSYGAIYPVLIGSLLHNATSIDDKYRYRDEWGESYQTYTPSSKISSWGAIFGYPLGIYAGSRMKLIDKDDFGKASTMTYFSQCGLGLGSLIPAIILNPDSGKAYPITSLSLSMALIPAGYAGAYLYVKDREIASGRGSLLYVTGVMGAATGLMLPLLSDSHIDENTARRIILSSTFVGWAAGTWLGLSYNPERNYSFWQSVFIGASATGGAAIALSVPLIAQTNKRQPYMIAGMLGGWAGFFLGDKLSVPIFEKAPQDKKKAERLQVDLPIATTWPLLKGDKRTGPAPLVNIRYGF